MVSKSSLIPAARQPPACLRCLPVRKVTALKGLTRLLQAAVQLLMPPYKKHSTHMLREVLLVSLVQCRLRCGEAPSASELSYG